MLALAPVNQRSLHHVSYEPHRVMSFLTSTLSRHHWHCLSSFWFIWQLDGCFLPYRCHSVSALWYLHSEISFFSCACSPANYLVPLSATVIAVTVLTKFKLRLFLMYLIHRFPDSQACWLHRSDRNDFVI